ncbi:MAG: ankyrin repeat domain-containing protein [Akkermansia sp.]|nr:ankyrin repeat domain-containing protein [Akkermansia sp.]
MKRLLLPLVLLTACSQPAVRDSLHAAVKRNDTAAVQQLLERGAEIDAMDADGLTPLMLACMTLQEENIRLLVQAGANPDAKNPRGTSARQMLMRGDSIPSRAPACRKALQEAEKHRSTRAAKPL